MSTYVVLIPGDDAAGEAKTAAQQAENHAHLRVVILREFCDDIGQRRPAARDLAADVRQRTAHCVRRGDTPPQPLPRGQPQRRARAEYHYRTNELQHPVSSNFCTRYARAPFSSVMMTARRNTPSASSDR